MQLTHSDGVEKYVQVLAKHTADIRKTTRMRSASVHQRLTTLPGIGNGVQRRQLPAVGGAPSVGDSVQRRQLPAQPKSIPARSDQSVDPQLIRLTNV